MGRMNERKGVFVVSLSFFYGNLNDVQGIQVSTLTIVFTTPLGAAVDSVTAAASCFDSGLLARFRCFISCAGRHSLAIIRVLVSAWTDFIGPRQHSASGTKESETRPPTIVGFGSGRACWIAWRTTVVNTW